MQLQKKQHALEKEMQRQKQQQEKQLQEDVHVVHQQKDLQDEGFLAEGLQKELADELQENLLVGKLQENPQEDLPQEGDVNLLSFFYFLKFLIQIYNQNQK